MNLRLRVGSVVVGLWLVTILLAATVVFGAAEQRKEKPHVCQPGHRQVIVRTAKLVWSRRHRDYRVKEVPERRLEVYGVMENDTGRPITRGKLRVEVYKRHTSSHLKKQPDERLSRELVKFGQMAAAMGSRSRKWSCQMTPHGTGPNAGKLKKGCYIRITVWSVEFGD